ncbi:unnamed protein product [Lathyrus oleraceus]
MLVMNLKPILSKYQSKRKSSLSEITTQFKKRKKLTTTFKRQAYGFRHVKGSEDKTIKINEGVKKYLDSATRQESIQAKRA